MKSPRGFVTRLTLALALLLLAYAAGVGLLARQVAADHERESLQRLSHGLARHIVGHWPEIAKTDGSAADASARSALLQMLMVVNPGIQVYLLDATGKVNDYIGEPGMVRVPQVDLQPVRQFLAGSALPLTGTDPMGGDAGRIFSAAMFPPRAGDAIPPGYLYIVLDGAGRSAVAGNVSRQRVWLGAAVAAAVGLLMTLGIGALAFRRLSQPLARLGVRMAGHGLHGAGPAPDGGGGATTDEVQALGDAFDALTARMAHQAAREQQQASAHREAMASVAHDLRTPLTALHGHLEALLAHTPGADGQPAAGAGAPAQRLLRTALAQSDKVRRLSQQLFELAMLQSDEGVLQRERFSLDELVSDAVQKFDLAQPGAPLALHGMAPGRLELDGDMHLVERALTNLIDNALRHAPGTPVRVSLQRNGGHAEVVVEDAGPGLPPELAQRLRTGQPLREPPIARHSGGLGGLGLAITQRIAVLHGGSLRPLAPQTSGTRLCLSLPLTP